MLTVRQARALARQSARPATLLIASMAATVAGSAMALIVRAVVMAPAGRRVTSSLAITARSSWLSRPSAAWRVITRGAIAAIAPARTG